MIYSAKQAVDLLYFKGSYRLKQEAQLPQRNSASAMSF